MKRHRTLGPSVLAVALATLGLLSTGCEDTEKLDALKKQTDQRIAELQSQGKASLAAAKKEVEELRAQLLQVTESAKAEAATLVKQAQADANEQEREAARALSKARDGYKAEARAKLTALLDDMKDASSKAQKAPAKAKASVQAIGKEVSALQKQITKDIAAFDKATLDSLKTVKAELNKHLATLKAKVASAKAKAK